MSEFTDVSTLGELQKLMRSPENDLQNQKQQLYLLAQILFLQGEKETGLERAALGGMFYCMQRMRELWNTAEEPTKTLEELSEIYASVELKRFTESHEEVVAQAAELKRDYIVCNAHRFKVNGREFFLLSSPTQQTTREGKRLFPGEVIETADPGVPNFMEIARVLLKEGNQT